MARRRHAFACGLVALSWLAAACTPPAPSSSERFQRWLDAGHREAAQRYAAYLRSQGVAGLFRLSDLLRSGRRWRECDGVEFRLPPPTRWPEIVPTLKLVADLRREGVLGEARVASAWRSADYNRCEGGNTSSRHLSNNALDFDVTAEVDIARLCAYWQRQGPRRAFGLGFYSPIRLHVDTAGFRTWGYDHHGGTSLCNRPDRSSTR